MIESISKAETAYVICISAAIGLAGMILPMINGIIYDRVIPSGTIADLMPIAALLMKLFKHNNCRIAERSIDRKDQQQSHMQSAKRCLGQSFEITGFIFQEIYNR